MIPVFPGELLDFDQRVIVEPADARSCECEVIRLDTLSHEVRQEILADLFRHDAHCV